MNREDIEEEIEKLKKKQSIVLGYGGDDLCIREYKIKEKFENNKGDEKHGN